MFKKAAGLTRPALPAKTGRFPKRGRSEVRDAMNKERHTERNCTRRQME
ncbi:MAG: hypothetical protein NTNFB02_20890 [Nitrospira sp.]